MNYFKDSEGNKISKAKIDLNVHKAKAEKLEKQREEHDYNFCETCKRNDCKPVTNAHIISVDRCQKDPNIPLEYAWDLENLVLEGLPCHKIRDGLN